jgi:hypothetical protein
MNDLKSYMDFLQKVHVTNVGPIAAGGATAGAGMVLGG